MVKGRRSRKRKWPLTHSLMELFWLVGEACAELSRIKAGMERSLLLHRVRLGTRRSYKAVVNSSCEERWIMLLSRLVHFTVVLLLLLYRGQSNAAPQVGDLNGQQEGTVYVCMAH